MTQATLQTIYDRPYEIFKTDGEFFNKLVKSFIDPLAKKYSVLDEIYIDGLDSSQVFGQTKMVLDGVGEELLGSVIPEIQGMVRDEEEEEEDEEDTQEEEEPPAEEKEVEEVEEELEEEEQPEDEESQVESEEEQPEEEEDAEPIHKDAFGLNDGFFDIDEFNKQVLAMENDNNDDEIDYFDSLSGDDDEMDYYNDFYDKPGKFKQQVPEKEEFEEDDYDNAVNSAMLDLFAEEEPQPKESLSSFEKQQKSIQAEIARLEAELVADKKWTMKGEITSKDRPQESLLEETEIAFDRTSKPVPVITEESTQTLEDLIRKRIKEDDFNDLPRRIITDISKFHKTPRAEVSEQKSSKSLAELYEDEYNHVDAQQESINEEVKKQHDEISELFTKVTHKLDALCSAHFIPKPHQAKTIDIKVTDSISMEDAQPLHVSNESRLAPQEIYKIGDDEAKGDGVKGKSQVQLKSGLSYSKDELSREDKQRLRRASKRKKAKTFNQRQETKRQKKDGVVDTLAGAKNLTVIGHKGEMRDIKGNLKKASGPQSSNSFKL